MPARGILFLFIIYKNRIPLFTNKIVPSLDNYLCYDLLEIINLTQQYHIDMDEERKKFDKELAKINMELTILTTLFSIVPGILYNFNNSSIHH